MSHANQSMKNNDNTIIYIVISVVLLFIFSVLMKRFSIHFFAVWLVLITPVAHAIEWLANSLLGDLINPLLGTSKTQANTLVNYLQRLRPEQLTFQGFSRINHFIGQYLSFIFIPVGVYVTVALFRLTQGFSKPFHRFKNVKSFNEYVYANADIKDPLTSNFYEEDTYEGDTAVAMSGARFADVYHIVTYNENSNEIEAINQEAAHKVFCQQLGKRYQLKQTKHKTRKTHKKQKKQILLNADIGWVVKKLLTYIPDNEKSDAFDFAVRGHLYESTVCVSLLYVARRFGVVPLAPFITLKKQYRALWYALTSCGRKVAFIEGAGILAQFEHEIGCKLDSLKKNPKPLYVKAAIQGLISVLEEEPIEWGWNIDKSLWDTIDPRQF